MIYAAKDSAFNLIEHLCARLSHTLSGVILPSRVTGESTPPSKIGKITPEERKEKEKIVLNDLMEKCCQY